jgi:hypothetical protein
VDWPLEPLLLTLGSRAELITAGDYNSDNPPLGQHLGAWAREVQAFIEVPLDCEVTEFIALEDFYASQLNRAGIDRTLNELSGDVREPVEEWLREGPDAEFIRLTEPDTEGLLIKAELVEATTGQIWDSRIPRLGLARAAIEAAARQGRWNV